MKLIVCSVYDVAAEAFGRPIFVPAVGLAMRSFTDEVNRQAPDNSMNQHPSDYQLYQLGTFDDSTGLFETGKPKRLAEGANLVTKGN